MSIGLNTYLNFDGDCAEAMAFYGSVLGVEPNILRFEGSPAAAHVPPEALQRVMHASIVTETLRLMASDTMPGMPFQPGTNVHLSLNFTDRDEQTRVYEALLAGGRVTMPQADQFVGRFGMGVDRFGVGWMFMLETPHG